jgi:hypothetical protein
MAGGTVQMGRIQPACFSWPSHFGLVAHHNRTGQRAQPTAALAAALPAPACRQRGDKGGVLGRHDDVVNSIQGQRGGVAHQGYCSTAVGSWPEGIGVEGVVGGRWQLGVGAGRRPTPGRCSGWCRRGRRRTGARWHRGGPWWRRRSSGRTLRCLCFNDNGAGLGLEGGGGTRGAAARTLKVQWHGPVDGSATVWTSCPRSARAGGSYPASGLGPF